MESTYGSTPLQVYLAFFTFLPQVEVGSQVLSEFVIKIYYYVNNLNTMFDCGYKSQYIGGQREKFVRYEI